MAVGAAVCAMALAAGCADAGESAGDEGEPVETAAAEQQTLPQEPQEPTEQPSVQQEPEAPAPAGAYRSLSAAVEALMEWLELVASSASDQDIEAGLRDIATPYGVEATAAAAMGDMDYVNHRTLVNDPGYAAILDSSLLAVRALSARPATIGEDRVEVTVWYTVVSIIGQPGAGPGQAAYYLSRFEFAWDETLGWRLDSAAAGDEMRVAGVAPSVIRSADSAAIGAQETLAVLSGHVVVRQLDNSAPGR